MTPLRKRYTEDLQLAGYSPKTIEAYVHAVQDLSKHYMRSPDQLTEEDVRSFFLHLKHKRKSSESTIRQKCFGVKWFFELTLKRPLPLLEHVRIRKGKKLPAVLNRTEVRQILSGIRKPMNKACLVVIYSCGLRLHEGVSARRGDVDLERKMFRVVCGKGKKDRYVPVPNPTLELLRPYILDKSQRSHWLFPSPYNPRYKHISKSAIQHAFRAILKEHNLTKKACVHTLRHSYATHLMERGIDIRTIQTILGHKRVETTMLYTHLTDSSAVNVRDVIDTLVDFL